MNRQFRRLLLTSLVGMLMAVALFWLGSTTSASPMLSTRQVNGATGSDSGDCIGTPCKTIQYAINQSSSGDLIMVTAGTYAEHITMADGVSIHGQGWGSTIIDGGYSAPQATVYIPSSVSASTVLSGVKVTGGGTGDVTSSIAASVQGGGITMYSASPVIKNVWVADCTAMRGGGVYINGGSPTFENVPLWSNQAQRGGGFYILGDANVSVLGDLAFAGTNGTVLWNTATMDGGGFYINNATVTLTALRIYYNRAADGGGVAIFANPHKTALWLNDISANTATGASVGGGGIYVYDAGELEIVLNSIGSKIIGGNAATGTIGSGGGVAVGQAAGVFHTNWILDNTASNGSGGGALVYNDSADLTFYGNWFEGNSSAAGGAMSLETGAVPQVTANTMVTNTAPMGAGIYFYQSGAAKILNNIIARNNGTSVGGGVAVVESPPQIINNTFADNITDGVWFSEAEGVVIVNNIIANNSGDGIERYILDPTTSYTADYNNLFGNGGLAHRDLPSGAHDLVAVNPQFVASGDARAYYHIQTSSPVSNTGSTTWAPTADIDADIRIFGEGVSMGADEIPTPGLFRVNLPLVLNNHQ